MECQCRVRKECKDNYMHSCSKCNNALLHGSLLNVVWVASIYPYAILAMLSLSIAIGVSLSVRKKLLNILKGGGKIEWYGK